MKACKQIKKRNNTHRAVAAERGKEAASVFKSMVVSGKYCIKANAAMCMAVEHYVKNRKLKHRLLFAIDTYIAELGSTNGISLYLADCLHACNIVTLAKPEDYETRPVYRLISASNRYSRYKLCSPIYLNWTKRPYTKEQYDALVS